MKNNRSVVLTILFVLLLLILGCGSLNPLGGGDSRPVENSEGSETASTDENIEEVMPEKTGVEECDELMAFIARQAQSKDDNYWTRATREFFLNRIRESLRKSIEENKNDPEELAKKCKEYKTQLETYKQKEEEEQTEKQ